MKNIYAGFLIYIILLTNFIGVFAQTARGAGNVQVTDAKGKTREVKLYDGSYALVIGESNYTNGWDALDGVKTDAAEVKRVLEKDFTVEVEMDLKSDALKTRIEKFISDYGYAENNRLLIYFAGHGHTAKSLDGRDLGYIIPVDAPLPKKDALGFKRRAIPMDTIQDYARRIEAKHALFVFDSCFSGKLVSREAMVVPPVIREDVTFPVRQFITAGSANQTVPDDSIFRKVFVRALEGEGDLNNDGYITGTELASFLKDKVTNATERAQTPQYGKIRDIDLERGDFVFVTENKSNADSTVSTQQNKIVSSAISGEAAFWQTIENSTDARDFESYLSRSNGGEFNGIYRAAAESKLYRIKKANAPAAWANFRETAQKLFKYEMVRFFSEDLAMADLDDDIGLSKRGLIDKFGKEFVAPKYGIIHQFKNGFAKVWGDSKCGFIDKAGREIVAPKYDCSTTEDFSEGMASVTDGQKHGFIDTTGKEVIPLKYDTAYDFSEGLALVSSGGKYGFIDKTGKEVITLKYDWMNQGFSEGLAPVSIGNKQGYIDKTGRMVIAPKYDSGWNFSEGLAKVVVGDKWAFIDKTGKAVTAFKYDDVESFSGEIATVRIGNKTGMIGKSGKEIIPPKYDASWGEGPVWWFSEGLQSVRNNDKWFFIDKAGKEIISLKHNYDYVGNFVKGLASVKFGDKYGFIDKTGKEIITPRYDQIYFFPGYLTKVKIGEKYGFIDETGKEVVPVKYDYQFPVWCEAFVKEGFIGVYLNNKKGFVDIYGNEYFDF